jgi:hypothetical protein
VFDDIILPTDVFFSILQSLRSNPHVIAVAVTTGPSSDRYQPSAYRSHYLCHVDNSFYIIKPSAGAVESYLNDLAIPFSNMTDDLLILALVISVIRKGVYSVEGCMYSISSYTSVRLITSRLPSYTHGREFHVYTSFKTSQ